MFKKYYHNQLRALREDAKDFAALYPSLAPMLAGQSPDPDVERLLEGVAYLSGVLHEKLDDEFPEIIHGLTDLIFPHYLRPLPSVTLVEFTPKRSLKETIRVKAGTQLSAKPIDGTSCSFRTTSPFELHPLALTKADFAYTSGNAGKITLSFELQGMPLESWNPSHLRLHLNAGYSDAADLLYLLSRYTESIAVSPKEEGEALLIGPDSLMPAGFDRNEALLPYPERSFPGYRILQEYFLFPEKFLFLDIKNLDKWLNKGKGSQFTIELQLGQLPFPPTKVTTDTFRLHVVPAINLFQKDADPLILDQRQEEYRVNPGSSADGTYEIHSIDSVTGIRQGSVEQRPYVPFEYFHDQNTSSPVYEIKRRPSRIGRDLDVSLAVLYPGNVERYERETLSIQLTCTNGSLPEHLGPGDIAVPTSTSPELATFRNILTPSPSIQPPLGSNKLWQFLSHLSLNFLSVASMENLREMLNLYVFPEEHDKSRVAANTRKVQGVSELQKKSAERLVGGFMMRGTEISLTMRQDHFASIGDMILFGSVLDYFFGVYSSMNSYTRLDIQDAMTGNKYSWKPRLGDRFLL